MVLHIYTCKLKSGFLTLFWSCMTRWPLTLSLTFDLNMKITNKQWLYAILVHMVSQESSYRPKTWFSAIFDDKMADFSETGSDFETALFGQTGAKNRYKMHVIWFQSECRFSNVQHKCWRTTDGRTTDGRRTDGRTDEWVIPYGSCCTWAKKSDTLFPFWSRRNDNYVPCWLYL